MAAGEVVEELLEHTAEGGEVLREIQQGAVGFGTEGDHLRVDVLANMSLQLLQARLQHGVQAVGADFRKAKGHAQRLLAFVQVEAVESLAEARQLVGLAQHQVNRRVGIEAFGVFFHPGHQLGRQGIALIAVGRQQFGQADH
ncbi:hypothetical protein D3C79_531930 [compost metagenome]